MSLSSKLILKLGFTSFKFADLSFFLLFAFFNLSQFRFKIIVSALVETQSRHCPLQCEIGRCFLTPQSSGATAKLLQDDSDTFSIEEIAGEKWLLTYRTFLPDSLQSLLAICTPWRAGPELALLKKKQYAQ